jgi:hypothetical protein
MMEQIQLQVLIGSGTMGELFQPCMLAEIHRLALVIMQNTSALLEEMQTL